jgi:predicted dehydrogenase
VIGVGVIGYGYWGPNLARNFADNAEVRLQAICDLRGERLAEAQRRYPNIRTTQRPTDLLDDARIDALAIATPVSSHYELARAALHAGKHVLVEKPLATTSQQARELAEQASRRDRVLMVDHTFIYTGAVQKIHDIVRNEKFGQLYYFDSVRVNLGIFQRDVTVLWDLAVHDLAILDYVVPGVPHAVAAIGAQHVSGQPISMAYLTLFFANGCLAHLHVNWLAPVKVRRTLIGGSNQMIVYDDLEPSEKVKVYNKGVEASNSGEGAYQMLVNYRLGDMWAPQLPTTEALKTEVQHFVTCIHNSEKPMSDGWAGLRVIRVLEAASESLARRGQVVELAAEA